MELKDLLKVIDDTTHLDIIAHNFDEPLCLMYPGEVPDKLLKWKVDYIGAQCEDVFTVFLIEKK